MPKPKTAKLVNELSYNVNPISSDELVQLIEVILGRNSFFQFQVKGKSMLPFIKGEDIVRIAPIETKRISPGRVVAYIEQVNQKLVIHRIIEINNGQCWIKGDNTYSSAISWVPYSSILGVVVAILRKGKKVWFVNGPFGRWLICLGSKLGIWAIINQWIPQNQE